MRNPAPAAKAVSAPAAYFITFICYGARLHGDEKGSVDRFHNAYGARFIDANPHRPGFESRPMKSPAELLDAARGKVVLQAIVPHANAGGISTPPTSAPTTSTSWSKRHYHPKR